MSTTRNIRTLLLATALLGGMLAGTAAAQHGGFHLDIGGRSFGSGGPYHGGGFRLGVGDDFALRIGGFRRRRHVCVPGHYQQVVTQVWVPARVEEVWVPPVTTTEYYRDWLGRLRRRVRVVTPGHCETRTIPGHYENQVQTRWVPGCCGR